MIIHLVPLNLHFFSFRIMFPHYKWKCVANRNRTKIDCIKSVDDNEWASELESLRTQNHSSQFHAKCSTLTKEKKEEENDVEETVWLKHWQIKEPISNDFDISFDVKLLINGFVNIPAIKRMNNVIHSSCGTLDKYKRRSKIRPPHVRIVCAPKARRQSVFDTQKNYTAHSISLRRSVSNSHTKYPTCIPLSSCIFLFFPSFLNGFTVCWCVNVWVFNDWFPAAMSLHVFYFVYTFSTASWIYRRLIHSTHLRLRW